MNNANKTHLTTQTIKLGAQTVTRDVRNISTGAQGYLYGFVRIQGSRCIVHASGPLGAVCSTDEQIDHWIVPEKFWRSYHGAR